MLNIHKELQDKYKKLFTKGFWGFEVPDTWVWIIAEYLKRTQWDVDKNGLKVTILQIKEKFGGLRIYTVPTEKEYLDAENIAYCTALANHTCVKCGCLSRDTTTTNSWSIRLCPACTKEKRLKRNSLTFY